jgi:hypothetical protein
MKTICLFFVLLAICYAQKDINTGEGLSALLFQGNGAVDLSTGASTNTLSQSLTKSFTFEAWVMLPNSPADGVYKAITSRYDVGPDQTFNNRWADFVFYVQASGSLGFFMGNGGASSYGVLIGAPQLSQNTWYHVGFAVLTTAAVNGTRVPNPDSATVFFNNQQFTRTWDSGSRQVPDASKARTIWLGDYFNQDGTHQWFRGYMDEVRFWSAALNLDQVVARASRVVDPNTANLLAYYRFNEAAGLFLRDSSNNKFDGRLSTATSSSAAPVWVISGAKINVDVTVSPGGITSIYLPGTSPNGALGFTYVVGSLPIASSNGTIQGAGRLLADGQFITQPPFALISNAVSFQAPNTTAEISFTYYGTYNFFDKTQAEPQSTVVYVHVGGAPCIPDQCGRCSGDGTSCSCLQLPYNGYNLNDVERILLLYEIEQSVSLLNSLETRLKAIIQGLSSKQLADLQMLINQVQQFGTNCLLKYCNALDPYLNVLAAIGPQ